MISVFLLWAPFLTFSPDETLAALAGSRICITDGPVLAQTVQSTVGTPLIWRTNYIALGTRPSLIALALIRTRADSILALLLAVRMAMILRFEVSAIN